MSTLTNNWG